MAAVSTPTSLSVEDIKAKLTSENFQNQLSTKTSGFLVKVADKLRMCGSTLLWLIGIIAIGLFISAVASFVEAGKVKSNKDQQASINKFAATSLIMSVVFTVVFVGIIGIRILF
jgi:hypothetical protein